MDSTPAETTVLCPSAKPERLIRFETADEFRRLPGYRDGVSRSDFDEGAPFRIIGGYGFKKLLWVNCGLTCNRKHGPGFVIRGASGLVTNIGHCCGRKLFGAVWQEMYEAFETQRNAEAVQDALIAALARRELTLKQAKAAREQLPAAAQRVREILAALHKFGPIRRAFDEVKRQRGSLVYFRDLDEDERALARGERTVRATEGNIEGISVASTNADLLEVYLRCKVIGPLNDLKPETLFGKPLKVLEQHLRGFAEMGDLVQQAELYVEDAGKFARPKNWVKFEKFCDGSKVKMAHEGYQILRRLSGTL